MQIDPAFEFRRLAEEYRAKTDDELTELAADFADLTEPAQQALRQEMQSRRLGDPTSPNIAHQTETALQITPNHSAAISDADDYTDPDPPDDDTTGPRDFTWKTVLCECEEWKQAWQLGEALRRAGIENWLQRAREFGLRYSRVLVAVDQLERARAIADQPIPKDIVDESEIQIPDYTPPVCPKCGASDPVLESVDPQNTWRCEQCGAQWADPAEVIEEKAVKSDNLPT
jgi:ribosomal protein L37AE/L43A